MYGQLNELRESIMNKVMMNQDLLKFIYYCDTDDKTDILSLPNLTKDQRKSLINTQIFKYKRMPLNSQTDAKCFLSMQFGKVGRSMKNPFWMQPYFEFTIVCPNAILETTVGDRMLAIEQCLTDTFEFQNVGNVGNVRISGSANENADSGYSARIVQLFFIDWIDRK